PVSGGATACQSGRLTQQVLGGATTCLGRFHRPGLSLWVVPPPSLGRFNRPGHFFQHSGFGRNRSKLAQIWFIGL
ncbi:unnamed protein product, partial [Musa textilis]